MSYDIYGQELPNGPCAQLEGGELTMMATVTKSLDETLVGLRYLVDGNLGTMIFQGLRSLELYTQYPFDHLELTGEVVDGIPQLKDSSNGN